MSSQRRPYPSDLSDAEWQILAPLIPLAKTGGRPARDRREILDAIGYAIRTGCSHTNFVSPASFNPYIAYEKDVSSSVHATGDAACSVALRQGQNLVVFVGNTSERTLTTTVRVRDNLAGSYRVRRYDSMLAEWVNNENLIPAIDVERGLSLELERAGFAVLELTQEV